MTRDLLVTPRRIAFVRSKENQLYETLMEMVVKKQDEIRAIINSTLEQLRAHVPSLIDDLEFPGMNLHAFTDSGTYFEAYIQYCIRVILLYILLIIPIRNYSHFANRLESIFRLGH